MTDQAGEGKLYPVIPGSPTEEEDTIAQPDEVEQEQPQEQPEPEQGGKWQWIGDNRRPEARESSDGLSDLFETGDNADTDDVVKVDVDTDIIDADPDGTIDSATSISEDDVLGDEVAGQIPLEYKPDPPRTVVPQRIRRRPQQSTPPPSLGGIR